jgi:hypothetical protein
MSDIRYDIIQANYVIVYRYIISTYSNEWFWLPLELPPDMMPSGYESVHKSKSSSVGTLLPRLHRSLGL